MVLEGFVKGRNNNFNFLRMVAAFSILIFHSFSLPYQETQKFFNFHIGDIDDFFIHIFFVTSGFLVTASLLHRQSLADFLWARALRIFPALFFMLVLSVILIGLFFRLYPLEIILPIPMFIIILLNVSPFFQVLFIICPELFLKTQQRQ